MILRRGWVVLGFTFVLAVAAPPHAAAIGPDAACTGSFTTDFSPALTNQNQTVDVDNDVTYNCTIGAQSGQFTGTFSVSQLSCVNLATTTPPFDEVVTWTGGTVAATSTIHYSSVMSVGQTATFSGSVTSGRFVGDAVVRAVTATSFQGSGIPELCPLLGGSNTLSSASGTVVLTITDTEP